MIMHNFYLLRNWIHGRGDITFLSKASKCLSLDFSITDFVEGYIGESVSWVLCQINVKEDIRPPIMEVLKPVSTIEYSTMKLLKFYSISKWFQWCCKVSTVYKKFVEMIVGYLKFLPSHG